MPLLQLKTSVALSQDQKSALLSSLSNAISQDTGKPER